METIIILASVFGGVYLWEKRPFFKSDDSKKLDALAKSMNKKFKHVPEHYEVEDDNVQ